MTKEVKEAKEFVIQPLAPRDKSKMVQVKRRKGIPLPKGSTFQDLSTGQREQHFTNVLTRWKGDYNKKRGTINTMLDLTQG